MSDVGRTAATPSAVVPGDGAAAPPGDSPPVDGTPSPGPAGTARDTRGAELAELRRLKRENAELRRANDILKAAAHFFGAELDRQSKK